LLCGREGILCLEFVGDEPFTRPSNPHQVVAKFSECVDETCFELRQAGIGVQNRGKSRIRRGTFPSLINASKGT
jgi:hypothetical protein